MNGSKPALAVGAVFLTVLWAGAVDPLATGFLGSERSPEGREVRTGAWTLTAGMPSGPGEASDRWGERPPVLLRAPATSRNGLDRRGVHASSEELTGVVQRTCVACHNDQLMTGNLSLQAFRVDAAAEHPEAAEKVIGKLRAEMMPPPGIPRPGGDTLLVLARALEAEMDEYAASRPIPASRPYQRLNRREYERVIQDLFGLTVDAGEWLPPDQFQANFDNMADVQEMSATLLTAYLNAAADISRWVLGHPEAPASSRTYRIPESVSQHQWEHVEGAPYGTRGGLVVHHHFPADGDYAFELDFSGGNQAHFVDIDVSINGESLAQLHYLGNVGGAGGFEAGPFLIPAGEHRVAVAFVPTADGPYEDLIRPHAGGHAGRSNFGTTGLPHLRGLTITGPREAIGISESESRARVLTCVPESQIERIECANEILSRIASQAFRRPVSDQELNELLAFYRLGEEDGGFDVGVRTGIEAILSSPFFTFRIERQPPDAAEGETYRLNDLELASRLSFFLWGTIPDAELVGVATQGRLTDPDVLAAQTRRMLSDRRSEALGERFAAQWLRLQDMDKVQPDVFWYPDFTQQVERDMRRETELFFNHLVREDLSVLELYNANYTFLNERLASHYGIRGVLGNEFRRVGYPADSPRKGILGHGSVLLLTSMGNRTSPVLRGKWVMEVLLGTPPPPPPPVPALDETATATSEGRLLTGRERLEIHAANPTCNACHQYMDPIGVALEAFDVDGRQRLRERGVGLDVDSQGTLYDGRSVESPVELAEALLDRPTPLLRTFTENLMAYALGRRVEYFDQPAIRRIVREAEAQDHRMSNFIIGVVLSDQFRSRTASSVAEID